ncbi:hypothetical protein OHA25_25215 [Nonomuraea sp. NBC_00507]|uniref:hypothetical protein n=1 Tax=Nonomuraea sp. NBC_00507 TaxID=2976002 RepID=UPI002E18B6E3
MTSSGTAFIVGAAASTGEVRRSSLLFVAARWGRRDRFLRRGPVDRQVIFVTAARSGRQVFFLVGARSGRQVLFFVGAPSG